MPYSLFSLSLSDVRPSICQRSLFNPLPVHPFVLTRTASVSNQSIRLVLAGRFAFIEFRTRELTDAAIQLDKLELCGRQMNIGRPKGYVVCIDRGTNCGGGSPC